MPGILAPPPGPVNALERLMKTDRYVSQDRRPLAHSYEIMNKPVILVAAEGRFLSQNSHPPDPIYLAHLLAQEA
jgi:hypothetical protein